MSKIYGIADQYVEEFARLDPVAATIAGVRGVADELTDYSPEGEAGRVQLIHRTLTELARETAECRRDRVCQELLRRELQSSVDVYDACEHYRSLNVSIGPMQMLRIMFDLMPKETVEDWQRIAARLSSLPVSLRSYQETLQEGADRGIVVSARQARGCYEQAMFWAGMRSAPSFFSTLLPRYDQTQADSVLRDELLRLTASASKAYGDFADFLESRYMPSADAEDAVGEERYRLNAEFYLTEAVDLRETYAWGWEQVKWVKEEMAKTAALICSDKPTLEVIATLETDPSRAVDSGEPFRMWLQNLIDSAMDNLAGTHFDLSDQVRALDVRFAPPSGQLAVYYTGPSEDLSQPGCIWYPVLSDQRVPLWKEVSIAYHEGVPGHHFQIATTKSLSGELSRYQRILAGRDAYVEGWALYAERLMGELGFLDNPEYYLGMLHMNAFRSARVVVDIGMHLKLSIPGDQQFHPGEQWTPQLGFEFLTEFFGLPDSLIRSEIDRYLGVPGQAIAYKVGERAWLAARSKASERWGLSFDLRRWHNQALALGPLSLEQMSLELVEPIEHPLEAKGEAGVEKTGP